MIRVLISRKLPVEVLNAARDHFDVTVRHDQSPMDAAEARVALQNYDAVLPTLGDDFSAKAFAGLKAGLAKFWLTLVWATITLI